MSLADGLPLAPPRRVPVWVPLALVALVVLAMGRIVFSDFTTWDDPHTLYENPIYNPPRWSELWHVWDPREPKGALWVPVTYTVWHLLAEAGWHETPFRRGVFLDARLFHAGNFAVHLASALLVALLARRLLPRRADGAPRDGWALFAGLIFGLHPVQVETVGWTSGMKDALWTLAALGAVYCYVRDAESGTPSPLRARLATRTGLYAAVVAAAAVLVALGSGVALAMSWSENHLATLIWAMLALFAAGVALRGPAGHPPGRGLWWLGGSALLLAGVWSKPTAMVVPALAVAVHRFALHAPWRSVFRSAWPWLVLAPVVALWTKFIQTGAGVPNAPLHLRPLVALDALAFYAWKFVVPLNLGFDYGRSPLRAVAEGYVWYTWLVPAAIAGVVIWRLRRGDRAIWGPVAAGLAWAVVAVSPVLGLTTFMFMFYSTVSDHYLYPAMAGLGLAAAAIAARATDLLPRGKPLVVGGAALLVVVWGGLTFRQSATWRDSMALYEQGLRVNPRSFAAYTNIGGAIIIDPAKRTLPNMLEALSLFDKAVEIETRWGKGWHNRSTVLSGIAEIHAREAIAARDRGDTAELARLQQAFRDAQRSASEAFARANAIDMEFPPDLRGNRSFEFFHYGMFLFRDGQYARAADNFRAAKADMDHFRDRDPGRRRELDTLIEESTRRVSSTSPPPAASNAAPPPTPAPGTPSAPATRTAPIAPSPTAPEAPRG